MDHTFPTLLITFLILKEKKLKFSESSLTNARSDLPENACNMHRFPGLFRY